MEYEKILNSSPNMQWDTHMLKIWWQMVKSFPRYPFSKHKMAELEKLSYKVSITRTDSKQGDISKET